MRDKKRKTKTIPGFEDYRVSEYGEIISPLGRILSPYDSNGYKAIKIKGEGGKRYSVSIHRAVALAFLGKIPKGYWVNHEDGNKSNNHYSNLKIATPSYNHKHAWRLGLNKGRTKELQAEAIKTLHENSWSQYKIAKLFECSQPNISKVIKESKQK